MAKVSLRPMALRPGGGGGGANPFAQFGKGAAAKSAAAQTAFAFEESKPKKPDSEIVRYTRDFLLQFSLKLTDAPSNLDHNQSECVINKADPSQAGASDALMNAIPAPNDVDDRNWRTRTELPPQEVQKERELIRGPAPQQDGKSASSAPQQKSASASKPFGDAKATGGPAGGSAPQSASLQSAASVGKKAWMPATSAEGGASALKIVKGILNKLTPEKFERLVGQLIEQVKSVDVLKGLIGLIFENAVEQPTFVAMYAELGQTLAEQLPDLAPPKGETKPVTFQKLLLNMCQDQFESTFGARQGLESLSGFELEAAERKIKLRTVGTIRLIAELYKKAVVKEPVVHACIQELLGQASGSSPSEDNVEALCEMLTIAGKKLDESSRVKDKVNGYFKTMEKVCNDKKLAPRIRFLVRDVLDLRRMKWVPRRETLKAKKLEEIRSEAHAELGMMPAVAMASLPPLPGMQQLPGRKAEDEVDLFPSFAGAENGGWEKMLASINSGGGTGDKGSSSALQGEYVPVAQQPAEAAAASTEGSNATPPQTTAAPAYIKDMSQEDREKRADGLFSEFLSSNDVKEAVLSSHELAAPGFLPVLVQRGVLKLLDCMTEREQTVISDILIKLPSLGGAYNGEDLQAGIDLVTKSMDDLMMDAPLAPKLCGGVIGRALVAGLLSGAALVELCKPIEGGETRRALVAPALQYFKETEGEEKLKELTAGLHASEFLEVDPELDPPDLPSVEDFLKEEKLTALSV